MNVRKNSFAVLAIFCFLWFFASTAHAAIVSVTNTNDSGAGSLRQAIADAGSEDEIDFSITGTIILTSGKITIDKDLSITGPGVGSLTISGNNASQIFSIPSCVSAQISDLTLANGNGGGSWGGAIESSGNLTILRCDVRDNTTGGVDSAGGGVNSYGRLIVIDSLFRGNSTGGGWSAGGAISVDGDLVIKNTTITGNYSPTGSAVATGGSWSNSFITQTLIAGNTTEAGGAALHMYAGSVYVRNSIFAGNSHVNLINEGSGVLVSNGYNIESGTDCGFTGLGDMQNTDPLLGALADNGGPTMTMALQAGSPAIDAIPEGGTGYNAAPATDQRGYDRDGNTDIGPFEYNGSLGSGPLYDDPSVITVTNLNDNGLGSLRQAIADASPGDEINFSVTGTITLTTGVLPIDKNITITGSGAGDLTIDGNNSNKVFFIPDCCTATITDLAIANGSASSYGGGVESGGNLTLIRCDVHHNSTGNNTVGGGLYCKGTLTVTDCVFRSNSTGSGNSGGGAIHADGDTIITNTTITGNYSPWGGAFCAGQYGSPSYYFVNCTVANNSSDSGSGAADLMAGTMYVKNSIFANNSQGNFNNSGSGAIVSNGYNIEDGTECGFTGTGDRQNTDPLLNALADNGGPTMTMALQAGSQAINAIPEGGNSYNGAPTYDQRGYGRDGNVDIGAFEYNGAPPGAEINLKQGATDIADGGSHDFGSHAVGSDTDLVFTVENTGGANLTLTTPLTIGGTNADQFSIQAQPTSPVAGSGSTTFTIRFSPTSAGSKTATIAIANNDSDENPYDLTITGTGAAPEMNLKQGATDIADGGSHDFGSHTVGTNTDLVFTIENTGGANLTLTTPLTVGGTDADQFSIQAQPTSPVAGSGSTTFTVRFSPTSAGSKTGAIAIANNDSDENPYNLTITGTATAPEMNLKQGTTDIADGGSHDFGSHTVGSDTDVVFTIENTGGANLTLTTPLSVGGTDAGQFSIQAQPTSPVAGSGSTTFTVRFSPTSAGSKTGAIAIANNDSDENPYNLTITATATAPEINLKQGTTDIADGGSHNFGSHALGTNTDLVFTIENTGNENLTLTTPLSVSGTNSDQFTIQAQPTSPVAGSGSTTFTVRFTPTSIGSKTGAIAIANNDSDENPYNLTITGTGYNNAPAADAGADQTPYVGDTVQLNGNGSTDLDSHSLTFLWSFVSRPDGSSATLSDSTAVNPTFVVDVFGTYEVQLIVNDGYEDSSPDTVTIDTLNSKPVADAGPDQTPYAGDTVQLDGSGSSDVDLDTITYAWSFVSVPAGSSAMLSDSTAVNPTFVVDVFGTYEVQLIVNDGLEDSAPDTVIIDTLNSKPVADAGADQVVTLGAVVTLDGNGSSDADLDEMTYSWALIVKPAGAAATLANAMTAQPTFTPDAAGIYVAQLIVNDGVEDSAPDTVQITANAVPPAPELIAPSGTIYTSAPTYSWEATQDGAAYYLWINDSSGAIFKQWYSEEDVSDGSICSVTPSLALAGGWHRWWVRAWNNGVYGPWSEGVTFTVDLGPPDKVTLLSPKGGAIGSKPTYTWTQAAGATWYYLWINDANGVIFTKWYQASVVTAGSNCSVTPSLALTEGAYVWWAQPWNETGGCGPWSDPLKFIVSTAVPQTPVSLEPAGPVATGSPVFSWKSVTGALTYRVWINNGNGNKIFDQTFDAATITSDSFCFVAPLTGLAQGAYTWWVRAANSNGSGPWSAATAFRVAFSALPSAPTPIGPSGTLSEQSLLFTWRMVNGATNYQLLARRSDGRDIINIGLDASVVTDGPICSTSKPITLPKGNYNWWVRAQNANGTGQWSGGVNIKAQ